ncbi:hypothetical protein BDV96DRAFT_642337 [Lophiotrema nucula]|uniref:Uncharacterized protein n=1 Tax=Lophiotrema nucula TaxID=690887 RepID=A0A6A5ZIG2_9PLEO|nr:hypothetical protein BDV96DRAFT_642337 [Lophiotrema nucula]
MNNVASKGADSNTANGTLHWPDRHFSSIKFFDKGFGSFDMVDPRDEAHAVYRQDDDEDFAPSNMHWDGFEDVDLDEDEALDIPVASQPSRRQGTFTSFDDLVDAHGRLRRFSEVVDNEAPFDTETNVALDDTSASSPVEVLSYQQLDSMDGSAGTASITSNYAEPEEAEEMDLSAIIGAYFSDPIWMIEPNLGLTLTFPEPRTDECVPPIPDIVVTPPSTRNSIAASPIPSILVHPPIDKSTFQAEIADTYRMHKKRPDVRRLTPEPKTFLQKRILLELQWRELEKWQLQNRIEAFSLMQELDLELADFINNILAGVNNNSFRDLQTIHANAQWALHFLRQLSPGSKNLRRLADAVLILSERTKKPAKKAREWRKTVVTPDPVWGVVWRAEVLPGNAAWQEDSGSHLRIFEELRKMNVSFPLEYSSFRLKQAQAKFVAWSGNVVANPKDPEYHMLTYAQKVTLLVLEKQVGAVHNIARTKNRYLALVKLGGLCVGQLEELCQEMLNTSKSGCTSTQIAGYQLGRICKQIVAIYHACQEVSDSKTERSSVKMSRVLKNLDRHKSWCRQTKVTVRANSSPSLHAHHTRDIANLFWRTAVLARQEIIAAHKPYRWCLKQCLDFERVIWFDWINRMHREVLAVREFKDKIQLGLLPSVDDFVIETLAWWEAKLDQAVQDVLN